MSAFKWMLKIGLPIAALIFLWYISIFWYKPFAIEDFYERVATRYMLPRQAWQTGAVTSEQTRRLGFLFKPQPPLRERDIAPADLAADLAILQSYRRERQNAEQLLSTDALIWQIQHLLMADTCTDVVHPFNPFSGIHLIFTERMLLGQAPHNTKDFSEYLKLMAGFTSHTAQALKTAFRLDNRCNKHLPCFAAAATKKQLERFLAVKPISNPIYLQFKKYLARLETGRDAKQELDAEALLLLETSVYPAFQAIYNYLDKYDCYSFLPPQHAIADTVQFYKLFNDFAEKTISPQSFFQYTTHIVDSLENEITKLLKKPAPDWQTAYRQLNEKLHQQNAQTTPPIVFAHAIQQAIQYLDTAAIYLFETAPTAAYQLYRIPVALEDLVPTGKLHPTEPKILFNPADSTTIPPAEIMAFVGQEIVPGRLMQRQYQRQQYKLPTFRRYWDEPVFTNGWSSYAATLLAEEAIFENTAFRCGLIHRQLVRAALAKVDVGMHLYGWTYRQAVTYLVRHTALPMAEINKKLHHILLFPAYSCTYLIGCRWLLQLRKQAQNQLGTLFDIRQFHHRILAEGALPPQLLNRVVKYYITSIKHQ
ncbi:MAG: DUF885 family protein [Cytophagales bacterium]|nr:DUF885 domain-containing protein [Bernardetiaceae bacterium]MDW8205425.1 DUF885 family protein [Cytophagales bacterium]